MPAKTRLDLHLTAAAAAQVALQNTGPNAAYDIENSSMEAFKAAQNDPADWTVWKEMFNERLAQYQTFSKQPSPSAAASIQKAQTAQAAKPAAS